MPTPTLKRGTGTQAYLAKVALADPDAETFELTAQKTMYGGKQIAPGAEVFVFASETEGGIGLCAAGVVTSAEPVPRLEGIERQTPRVNVTIRRTGSPSKRLGRAELKAFTDWDDGRPETELNFKFYRQATNKIGGISETAAAFLRTFF